MQNDPTTDNPSEPPYPDAEDWQVAFQAYAAFPILAFILAQHFDCLKELIERGPQGAIEAIATLDLAIESLQPYTKFRDAGHAVYLLAVAGKLRPDQENN